jgi:hypothetical protein
MKIENKQTKFYILGYLLQLIIKYNDLGEKKINLANLGYVFHGKSFV